MEVSTKFQQSYYTGIKPRKIEDGRMTMFQFSVRIYCSPHLEHTIVNRIKERRWLMLSKLELFKAKALMKNKRHIENG